MAYRVQRGCPRRPGVGARHRSPTRRPGSAREREVHAGRLRELEADRRAVYRTRRDPREERAEAEPRGDDLQPRDGRRRDRGRAGWGRWARGDRHVFVRADVRARPEAPQLAVEREQAVGGRRDAGVDRRGARQLPDQSEVGRGQRRCGGLVPAAGLDRRAVALCVRAREVGVGRSSASWCCRSAPSRRTPRLRAKTRITVTASRSGALSAIKVVTLRANRAPFVRN